MGEQSPVSFDKRATACRLILLGTLAAILYHFVLMRLPVIAAGYPYDTFLFNPLDRFNDFKSLFRPLLRGIHPYRDSVYFPGLYVILNCFLPFRRFALLVFLLVSVISTSTLVLYLSKNRSIRERLYLLAAVLVSYPMLFGLDRANLEVLLLPLVLLWWILRSKGYHVAAAMCLGLAGSTKLHPLLLLLPDLMNLRLTRLVLTAVFAGLFTLLGLLTMPAEMYTSVEMLKKNLNLFQESYISLGLSLYYSVSAISMLKTIILIVSRPLGINPLPVNAAIADYWSIVLFAGLASMLWAGWTLRRQPEWKSLFVAVAAMLLLSPVSGDYRLLHLLLPFILFLNSAPENDDRRMATLFALLLIPKSYLFLVSIVSIAVVLNPCLLIVTAWCVMRHSFAMASKSEESTSARTVVRQQRIFAR